MDAMYECGIMGSNKQVHANCQNSMAQSKLCVKPYTWPRGKPKPLRRLPFYHFLGENNSTETGSGLIWSIAPDPFRRQFPFSVFQSSQLLPPEIHTFSRWERKPRVLPRRSPPPASPRPRQGRSPSPQRSFSPGSSARSFLPPFPPLKLRLLLLQSI